MTKINDEELKPSAAVEVVEDGMIGDADNGIPHVEVDPATGEPIETQVDDTPKYSEFDAVQAALSAQPVAFEKEINGLLADRLQAAVEKRREEIAQSIFNGEVEEPGIEDSDASETGEEESSESEPVEGEKDKQPEE